MKLYKTVYKMRLQIVHPNFANLFASQKFTSLPISTINDVPVAQTQDGGIASKQIPNPNANKMLIDYNENPRTVYSETIVEYKDENDETLLYLFPDGSIFRMQDVVLTGESRRDLIMETQARRRALREIKSNAR